MKIGDRKQQGRTGNGKTGENPREECPACKDYYLQTYFVFKNRKLVKFGKVCPNELCTFSRKD